MPIGQELASLHEEFITSEGSIVTINRRGVGSFSAIALIQNLDPNELSALRAEGSINVDEAHPTYLSFPGSVTIEEAIDRIEFSGWSWRVQSSVHTVLNDYSINNMVMVVREKKL